MQEKKGLTVRLSKDTLAMLEIIKQNTGMTKGSVVDMAVTIWHKKYYPQIKKGQSIDDE